MLLELFEREADALLSGLTRARYLEASGRWPSLSLTPGFERYPDVYSLDTYEQLLDADVEERIGEGLRRMVLTLFAESAAARHDQRLVNWRTSRPSAARATTWTRRSGRHPDRSPGSGWTG
jgi:hypothetical protein